MFNIIKFVAFLSQGPQGCGSFKNGSFNDDAAPTVAQLKDDSKVQRLHLARHNRGCPTHSCHYQDSDHQDWPSELVAMLGGACGIGAFRNIAIGCPHLFPSSVLCE